MTTSATAAHSMHGRYIHILHRMMMNESVNNKWVDEGRTTTYDPPSELEKDALYYESLQEKRKKEVLFAD
jgi:hypothetical protein